MGTASHKAQIDTYNFFLKSGTKCRYQVKCASH